MQRKSPFSWGKCRRLIDVLSDSDPEGEPMEDRAQSATLTTFLIVMSLREKRLADSSAWKSRKQGCWKSSSVDD